MSHDGELDGLRRRCGELLTRLEDNEREFRRLARAVWRVQEDERGRIARELHDGIGQNLTVLKMRLAVLGGELGPGHERLRTGIEAAMSLCAQTLEDTRRLSRLLRPQILDDLGLAPALRWLARSFGDGGPAIVLDVEALPELDGDRQTLVFRIVQEALGNAIRHAGASRIRIGVAADGDELSVEVADDGRGCDPQRALAAGGGLSGMRQRLRLHGGRLEITSAAGAGLQVRAALPRAERADLQP